MLKLTTSQVNKVSVPEGAKVLCYDKVTQKIAYLDPNQLKNCHMVGFIIRQFDDDMYIPPFMQDLDDSILYLLGVMFWYGCNDPNALTFRIKSNNLMEIIIKQLNQFGFIVIEIQNDLDYKTFEIQNDNDLQNNALTLVKLLGTVSDKNVIYWMTLINYFQTGIMTTMLPDNVTLTFPDNYNQYCYVVQQILAKNNIKFSAFYDTEKKTVKIIKCNSLEDLKYISGYAWFANSWFTTNDVNTEQCHTSETSINNIELQVD